MQQQQRQGMLLSAREGFNLLYFLSCVGFETVAPFLRSQRGKRAGGVPALVAGMVILFYAGSHPEMIHYLECWVVMVAYRRLTSGKPEDGVFSEYQGYPYTTAWLIGDEMLSRLAEAVLVWIAGNYLMPWSEPLGNLLAWGSLALGIKYWIDWLYLTRLDEAIQDEVILMKIRMAQAKRRQ